MLSQAPLMIDSDVSSNLKFLELRQEEAGRGLQEWGKQGYRWYDDFSGPFLWMGRAHIVLKTGNWDGTKPQKLLLFLPPWIFGKESLCQCRGHGFNPWTGKILGEGNDNPLQYSSLGNPMDRAWWTIVYGVTKSRTRLSNWALES